MPIAKRLVTMLSSGVTGDGLLSPTHLAPIFCGSDWDATAFWSFGIFSVHCAVLYTTLCVSFVIVQNNWKTMVFINDVILHWLIFWENLLHKGRTLLLLLTIFVTSFNSKHKQGRSGHSHLQMRESKLSTWRILPEVTRQGQDWDPHSTPMPMHWLLYYMASRCPDKSHHALIFIWLYETPARYLKFHLVLTPYLPWALRTRARLSCLLFWVVLIRTIHCGFTKLTLLVLADHFCQGLLNFSNGSLWVLETGVLFWKELLTSIQHLLTSFCESPVWFWRPAWLWLRRLGVPFFRAGIVQLLALLSRGPCVSSPSPDTGFRARPGESPPEFIQTSINKKGLQTFESWCGRGLKVTQLVSQVVTA